METIVNLEEVKRVIESSNVSEESKVRILEEMEYHHRFEIKKLVEETVFDLQEYDRLIVAIHNEFGLLDINTCLKIRDVITRLVEAHSTIDYVIGMVLFSIDKGFEEIEIDIESFEE